MKLAASLLAMVLAAGANAATVVLYETGWEAVPPSPARPAWVPGNVTPQNSWNAFGRNPNESRHRVVANGSADANPFGTPVTTPYGSQFHRFTASSSTTTNNEQYAWPDLGVGGVAFASRPAGYNIVTCSLDMFVPSSEASDFSIFGIVSYDGSAEHTQVVLQPNGRLIGLFAEGVLKIVGPSGAFPYGAWFQLSVSENYDTGEIIVRVDGTAVPGMTVTDPNLVGAGFTDFDLICQNSKSSPNPRVVFSDNYRVTAEAAEEPRPTLSITIGPPVPEGDPPIWHLSWGAAFSTWILESSPDLGSPDWFNEGAAQITAGDVCSSDLQPNPAPARTFYRLRKP